MSSIATRSVAVALQSTCWFGFPFFSAGTWPRRRLIFCVSPSEVPRYPPACWTWMCTAASSACLSSTTSASGCRQRWRITSCCWMTWLERSGQGCTASQVGGCLGIGRGFGDLGWGTGAACALQARSIQAATSLADLLACTLKLSW